MHKQGQQQKEEGSNKRKATAVARARKILSTIPLAQDIEAEAATTVAEGEAPLPQES